jgi:hypothetical protein
MMRRKCGQRADCFLIKFLLTQQNCGLYKAESIFKVVTDSKPMIDDNELELK